jgi:hypothetical protein
LYLRVYDKDDQLARVCGPETTLSPGGAHEFAWRVPETGGYPIAEIGVEAASEHRADGSLYLDYLTWDGTPDVAFAKPEGGSAWRRAWVEGVDQFASWGEPYRLVQDYGTGLLIQGTREWTDYRMSAEIRPHMVESAGIAARVQGMRRYYALLLVKGGKARLVKMRDTPTTLAEAEFPWQFGGAYRLSLQVTGDRLQAAIDDRPLCDVQDAENPLTGGAIALVCEVGRMAADAIRVQPV